MVPADLAACAMRARRAGVAGQSRDLRGQALGREVALLDADRPAGGLQHAGIDELVLIERMRQRHQDGRPADGGKLGHRGGAGAGDHQMGGRHARRQVGKERRDLGGDAEPGISARAPRRGPRRAPAARRPSARADRRRGVRSPPARSRPSRARPGCRRTPAGAVFRPAPARHRASPPRRSPRGAPDCR